VTELWLIQKKWTLLVKFNLLVSNFFEFHLVDLPITDWFLAESSFNILFKFLYNYLFIALKV